MNRTLLGALLPPLAVCRYGCAGCCAAPIGVFWIAGIVLISYMQFSSFKLSNPDLAFNLSLLGVGFIALAITWTQMTIRAVDADRCKKRSSPICSRIVPSEDEPDPFEEVKKAQQ